MKSGRFAWLRRHGSNLVMLGLFMVGIVVLYRLLHKVDIHQVRMQIHALAWTRIGLAALSTAAGYLALVGYDRSALRYIRKQLSLPLVAFTSFVGYALSNTIGASWLSGGAVRYLIYSRVGLSASKIAFTVAFTTLGFGKRMKAKIDSPSGRMHYSRLGTVEPPFANLRYYKGLDRFTLRGQRKVNGQWKLYALVHNIEKLAHYAVG